MYVTTKFFLAPYILQCTYKNFKLAAVKYYNKSSSSSSSFTAYPSGLQIFKNKRWCKVQNALV